jgi:hypothetical protein
MVTVYAAGTGPTRLPPHTGGRSLRGLWACRRSTRPGSHAFAVGKGRHTCRFIITHGTLARTRVLHFNRWQLAGMLIGLVAVLTLLSGTVYHFVFLKAAREGWPVVSQIVRLVVQRRVRPA